MDQRWLAIDFGTTRTKVAHLVPGMARPDRSLATAVVPSLAYAPADGGPLLFGDDAEAMLGEPVEVIDLSRQRLRRERIWRSNGRSLRLANVMRELLVYLHAAPDHLVLTVSALAGPQDEALLCGAATVAFGVEYASDRLSVLTEAMAAATVSLAAEGNETQEVIVVDVGGGTIDWAWVRRDHGRLRLVPDPPPGNLEKVGDCDIDRALLGLLWQGHGSESGIMELLQGCEGAVLAQLALIKQSLGWRREQPVVRVHRYHLLLVEGAVRQATQDRLIGPAVAGIRVFLAEVIRQGEGTSAPPILLTGGATRTPSLEEAITSTGWTVLSWETGDIAVIMGAVKAALSPVEPASTGLCDIVIDVTGKWHTTDLAKVLELAAPDAIIKVRPGLYEAQPVIDKPVEIVGEEEAGPTTLMGRAGPVVISHETKVHIAKIAILQDDTSHGAIVIERGQLVIEACEISSNINMNEIIGVNADPIIRHNKIQNCKDSGISIPCSGCRIIKDNEISWHKYSYIVIKNDADPLGCRNQTLNGRSNIIPILENGRGTIDDNDILGHGGACILMTTRADLVVCRHRIHNGSNTGVYTQ